MNDLELAQRILRLWQQVTSKPMTTRELEFAKLVTNELQEANNQLRAENKLLREQMDLARNDERTAMSYLSEIREAAGGAKDFPTLVDQMKRLKGIADTVLVSLASEEK